MIAICLLLNYYTQLKHVSESVREKSILLLLSSLDHTKMATKEERQNGLSQVEGTHADSVKLGIDGVSSLVGT